MTDRPSPRSGRRVRAVLVPATLLIAAGTLFVRVPGGERSELPDPEQMALLGDSRHTSTEIVEFWRQRASDAPQVANRVRLADAQLTLAGDTGDLDGYAAVETLMLHARSESPDDPDVLLTLAAARAGQHDFRGALELAEQVLADTPTSVAALLAAGDARLELGEYAAADTAYRRAAERVGAPAPLLSRLARLEAATGSIAEAQRLAERALVDAGDRDLRHADAAFYWFQLATYDFAVGHVGAAAERLDAALAIDPDHLGALELQARVLGATGDLDGAAAAYETLVADGGAADLHGELAKVYERLGRHRDAAEQIDLGLAAAAESADRYPAERRHLIGFLSDHDPAEALRLARLDLAERQDVMAHAWHAWALYQTGDVAAARAAIEPALAHGTEDARLLYQAAAILHAAAGPDGDSGRALHLIRRSQALNPVFDLEHGERAAALLAVLE